MKLQLCQLEERVAATAALIGHLRAEVARLETAVAERTPPATEPAASDPPADEVRALREEIARLHAERAVVRERVRSLIREIDGVTW